MSQTPSDFYILPDDIYDIYKLEDPIDHSIHYIGISTNVAYRYKQHIKRKHCNPQKVGWIQGLQERGLQPKLEIIEQGVKGRNSQTFTQMLIVGEM